jgi:hypothetical protein
MKEQEKRRSDGGGKQTDLHGRNNMRPFFLIISLILGRHICTVYEELRLVSTGIK